MSVSAPSGHGAFRHWRPFPSNVAPLAVRVLNATPFSVAVPVPRQLPYLRTSTVEQTNEKFAVSPGVPSEKPALLAPIDPGLPQPARMRMSPDTDRKSTRLNSSHANSSYAVFCLK